MEVEQCELALTCSTSQRHVAQTVAAGVNHSEDAAARAVEAEHLARALESYRAGKWIPSRTRLALALAGHDVSTTDNCTRAKHQAHLFVGRLGEETLSQNSELSTCSGDTEGDWNSASSVVSRRVRFSHKIDVVEVEHLSVAEIVGSREHGTCWSDMASWRQDRFRIRVHSVHRCCQRACCHAGGLCSGGGRLASEVAMGLADIFSAWRILQGIPATVPVTVMNRGRCWPA